MLKKLILKNWKSFRDAELPIDPLTVLIGANASGKSNVIEALEFLKRTVSGKEIHASLAGDSILPPLRGSVEEAPLRGESSFTLEISIQGNNQSDYLYSITVQTKPNVQLEKESFNNYLNLDKIDDCIPLLKTKSGSSNFPGIGAKLKVSHNNEYLEKLWARSQSIISQTSSLFNFQEENSINPFSDFQETIKNIYIINPIPSRMRDYSQLSDRLESDASNIAGVLATLSDKQKEEFESTVATYLRHLPERDIQRVWAEPVGRFGTDAMLYCKEEWKPGEITEIDARVMSDGSLRFLAILTALMTRPKGSQIVIEEVDNGLHPSRVGLLLKMLKEIGEKRNIDILVTTHNPALLDALDPGMIPFVILAYRDAETGESKLTPVEDIENFPKLYASASLGKLTAKGAIERSISRKQ
ncbi:AAA family ATPase [Coleofasciculus sp. F4-SAH-05]|jgi:predicted ATPase|uniref:AAA family ATPase n=1 Tax=Coleofasciculus sp. F4-SAH-05 TaxID=3069525 RepID=UPI0032FC12BC